MKTTLSINNSISCWLNQRRLFPLLILLPYFALSNVAYAVTPAPDGGYPGGNTAEGINALFSRTTGTYDTALGFYALYSDTSGIENTATGAFALRSTNSGSYNTATGYQSLYFNTTGISNTATGLHALFRNTTGRYNTATGLSALYYNSDGESNTASGVQALFYNTHGISNTAHGTIALFRNTTGTGNTGIGDSALSSNTVGNDNTALGHNALRSTTGGGNLALGTSAGFNVTGNYNIDIANNGVAGESRTIRIGDSFFQNRAFIAGIRGVTTANANAVPVVIDTAGQLGTASSSRRFKKEIKPMEDASEAILALKPVTFHYKSDITDTPQFGLIAEEVAKVDPDLVVKDENGKIYTVRYEAVNAMLLNEFLKQHHKVEAQDRRAEKQETKIAQQQKDIQALTVAMKEQAAQIQKVSAQLELTRSAPQLAGNHQ